MTLKMGPEEDCWFHGNISRKEAETKLLQDGEDGSFLVRESTSSKGDYAIAVLSGDQVDHYQIWRHHQDAFFSIDEGKVIHGLDELIRYYRSLPPSDDKDSILLKKPLVNSPPPPECRRHGRTNLLHRATKEENLRLVHEMVCCGDRNLDAKNEEGQTAVHIASIKGSDDILLALIKAGANVNAKDCSDCTPLHYACIHDKPEAARILLSEGRANPQLRRSENGWVPMHEAAAKGHIECIKVLLQYDAPMRPRTLNAELPVDLAIANNLSETVEFLGSYQVNTAESCMDDWYHGCLERQEAFSFLKKYCNSSDPRNKDKLFYLVRRSSKKPKVYVLTLLFEGNLFNYEIKREGKFFYIDDGPYLDSLEHVVDHYTCWADGLPCTLEIPVGPTRCFPPEPGSRSNSLDVPPPLPERTMLSVSPNTSYRLSNEALKSRPDGSFSKENIPYEWIKMEEIIGEGEYGAVYKGRLTIRGEAPIDVAIKTLKTDDEMQEWAKNEFLQEARVMLGLEHDHIVKIIGLCWSPNVYMVQELMSLGSMQDYLIDHKEDVDPVGNIALWSYQIAKGMVYLQSQRFVHRDLAARNILLANPRVAKISDFGLSRALGCDSNYYTASHGGRWPIKWYAPESCTHGTFSHASDVWSFGVTLWEMYSYGDRPYGDMTGANVIELVENGGRLEKPADCPPEVFDVMMKCWSAESDKRPTFKDLEDLFSGLLVSTDFAKQCALDS